MTNTPEPVSRVALTVQEIVHETASAVSLVFAQPAGEELRYRSGQFLTFRIPTDDGSGIARCYSLSSSPETDRRPRVTIKRIPGGVGSNWLCDNATAGMELEVLEPAGSFTLNRYDADVLLCAGGSGITPVISIIKSMLARGTGNIVLLYANRSEADVIFAAELEEIWRANAERFSIIHWLDAVQGFPAPDLLCRLFTLLPIDDVYLCGPAPFMAAVRDGLSLAGEAANVYAEVFTSLSGDPFAQTGDPASPSGGEEPAATAVVDLDGRRHTLAWPRGKTLVDVLLAAGIDVPYSCREGSCGSCACTVTAGKIRMEHCHILDPADIGRGAALGCQARPVSDEVSVTFD